MKRNLNFYLVPQGGLANRMRAIASSLLLAEKYERKLIIIWNKDRFLNADFATIFDSPLITNLISSPNKFKYHLFYEMPRKKNIFISRITNLLKGKVQINVDSRKSVEELNRLLRSGHRDLIVHSGIIFEDFKPELIKKLFQPSQIVKDRIYRLVGSQIPDIAVQIRRTDNIESIKKSPTYLFEKVIEEEIAANPGIKIFLATDDQSTKLQISKKFEGNIIINRTPAQRNTSQGIIDATAEMYVMANCRKIYGSYWSSFSEIASCLGDVPLEVIKNS